MDQTAEPVLPQPSAEERRKIAKASQQGTELLTAGLGVAAIGIAGAALGAVCPLCVVATPALLGLGTVQKLRAKWLERKARKAD